MIGLGHRVGRSDWVEKLRHTLWRCRGARLGEASVVSRQMHEVVVQEPERVIVLSDTDAGQQFYHRAHPGEVIHVDICHEVGDVDHRALAAALCRVMDGIRLADHAPGAGGKPLADYFDIQTGTGGGRLTGSLSYGQTNSLKQGHKNHVHLAGLLPDEQLHLLSVIVGAVENEVIRQGLEIRRVESLFHPPAGRKRTKADMKPYSEHFDTYLRGERGVESQQSAPDSAGKRSLRSAGWQEGAVAGGAPGGEAGGEGESFEAVGAPTPRWSPLEIEHRLEAALQLSQRLGSPDEVKRVLDELLQAPSGWSGLAHYGSSQTPFLIRQLEDEGLVRRDFRGLRLTEEGRELAAFLERHLRDVKLRFRKLVRRLPGAAPRTKTEPPSADVRYGRIAGTAPAEPGAWLSEIAVPQTVVSAIRRSRLAGAEGAPGLTIRREDIHINLRAGEQPLHICLLIDASASMAGRRILAAKHLARHLLISTRDRIAVVAFQEKDVKVHVPFTRDWAQVEAGLSRIQPMGLTPLAEGLTRSLELMRESRVRRSLLLLITDGIPTVPKWTIDPLADALQSAQQIGQAKVPFGCIGLQPSRRYLEELSKAAGGTLHVVEELSEESLVLIAHRERSRANEQRMRGTASSR